LKAILKKTFEPLATFPVAQAFQPVRTQAEACGYILPEVIFGFLTLNLELIWLFGK
jgi:hypothetical protein